MEDVVIGLGTELFGQFSWWYIDIDGWWYDYKCVVIILYSWIHWCGHFLDMSPISLRGLFRKTPIICEWLHDHSPARAFISCHLNGSLPKICHFIGQKILQKGGPGALVSHHASEARNGDATPSNSGQSCRYPKKVGFCLSWFVIGGKVNKLPLFFLKKQGEMTILCF